MKKKLNQSTAKFPVGGLRRLALFLFLLLGLGGLHLLAAAQTVSSVVVTPITARYNASPPTVTFKVSWPAGTRDADHRSKVWLLVDYRRIQNNAYTGSWLRAGISTAQTPTANAGSVLLEPGNDRGFWLQGTDGAFAATVTVPVSVELTGYASQFGWCGIASDRPPYAEEKSGYYILHGTPDFIIQTDPGDPSQTVTEHTTAYNDCIYALTDSTGAPGETPLPVITGFTASTTSICRGQSATLTATATDAQRYSFDNGVTWVSSPSTIVSPTAMTTYTLKVTRENGACTVTYPESITVTVKDVLATPTDASSNTRCGSGTLTFSATVPDGITIDWYTDANGGSIVATGNTYTPNVTAIGVTTYYAEAQSSTTSCANATRLPVSGTVKGLPTITLASGSNAQTVTPGSAITEIKYTTTHATGANLSNQPAGVSGTWTNNTYAISGTPSSVGIFNYTVTTTNSNSCANATANGTITVEIPYCIPATLNLGTVGFTSSTTYTRNGITVSSPVTATYCNKTAYSGGSSGASNADCRTSYATNYGHVFSWCLVAQYAAQLCPSPWRVPSVADLCQYATGSTSNCSSTEVHQDMDGWISRGFAQPTGYFYHNERCYYWTSSLYAPIPKKALYLRTDSVYFVVGLQDDYNFGYALRCVK
jgi:uncharacterized protein (TIGR02145 family)